MSFVGKLLIKSFNKFSYVKGLVNRIHEFEKYSGFPPGHYYSPLVNPDEFIKQKNSTFNSEDYLPHEINFNLTQQEVLLKEFEPYYDEIPFGETVSAKLRYSFNNDFFTYSDAITLYCLMRIYKPKRIIEIGSGYSSALVLDTNEIFFNNQIAVTFIEPNADRLNSILKGNEPVDIIKEKIQDTDVEICSGLEDGDFLLIDTSHVSKSGGDVNHIYFNILPNLKKGVRIHIHDIFFPFEYPEKWVVEEKRSWNEIFLLRAFLAYNNTFRILFFNDLIQKKHLAYIEDTMPLFLKRNSRTCGGIWIEKIN